MRKNIKKCNKFYIDQNESLLHENYNEIYINYDYILTNL